MGRIDVPTVLEEMKAANKRWLALCIFNLIVGVVGGTIGGILIGIGIAS